MKVRGGRDLRLCVYMPTDCMNSASIEGCYEKIEEDVLSSKEKGRVVDFNARVGKSVEMDDVIGMFGEDTWNYCI